MASLVYEREIGGAATFIEHVFLGKKENYLLNILCIFLCLVLFPSSIHFCYRVDRMLETLSVDTCNFYLVVQLYLFFII